MNWIDKLERKFGRFGVENLTMYVIICYVVGYFLAYFNPSLLSLLSLEPALILRGQIWRIITWVIYPPSMSNVLWFVIAIVFFYYPIGTSLERTWGSFRYTLYIFSGILFSVIGAFILYFITGAYGIGSLFNTYYISLSVFLAYALSYPDMQILLWFVIPIKMKWMAIVYGVMVLYDMITYLRMGRLGICSSDHSLSSELRAVSSAQETCSDIILRKFTEEESSRKRSHRAESIRQQEVSPSTNAQSADRTEKDDPNLEFRFCSKCNGNYEYCQDHLFTHQHVK